MSLVSVWLFFCRRRISSEISSAESSCTKRSSSILASSSAIGCSKSRKVVFIGGLYQTVTKTGQPGILAARRLLPSDSAPCGLMMVMAVRTVRVTMVDFVRRRRTHVGHDALKMHGLAGVGMIAVDHHLVFGNISHGVEHFLAAVDWRTDELHAHLDVGRECLTGLQS